MDTSSFARQVDVVIKAYSAAQVIPSTEAIAVEVLRQQQLHTTLQRGMCVSRELLQDHRNEEDMVRDAGLAYRDTDENAQEIFCPICLTYCENIGYGVITSYPKLHIIKKSSFKKSIERHLRTARHKQAISLHIGY